MYKDSSCRSSPPTTTATDTADTAAASSTAATTAATTKIGKDDTEVSATVTATAETPAAAATATSLDDAAAAEEDDAFSCPSESSSDADDDHDATEEYVTRSRPSTASTNSTNSSTTSSSGSAAAALACRANNATAAHVRRVQTAPRLDVNTDVRLLRKIGYIASRVRFLAKLYGDFKLVNPYSPAKQRRQLQEILLRHSIIDPARELAKAAAAATPASPVNSVNTRSSLTPSSSSVSSSYCCLPQHESSSLCGNGGGDDETAATSTAGTVRRRSSGGTGSAATASSILLLEDLLVQFYEDRHRNKLTVIRRRRSRRSSSGGGAVAVGVEGGGGAGAASSFTAAATAAANGSRKSHLFIMSGKTASAALASSSSVERLLLSSNDNEEEGDGADLLPSKFLNANTSGGGGGGTASSQAQFQLLQRQAAAAFLQPSSGGGGVDDNSRRRRASDCSTHPGQLLSQQLQVTLKNNNCAKFPFHRGSCGAAGEHLLAANSIANRSTIILSKSCSNVDGAVAASNAAALYSSSDLRNLSGVCAGGTNAGGTGVCSTGTPSGSGIAAAAAATNGNNEYSIVQLNNTIIQCHFNDDDFRALVKDLKRKVEYTERMNWLCLSKRPMGPPHRKSSLPKHQDVKRRFLEICDTTFSDEVKAALRLPAFDSYEWGDADVIHLMQTMFIELGFIDKFQLPVETLREWLYEVYKHYNEVPFHNFRHCFCVAQMMYAITRQANLLQRLGDLECLILLVSCICHDLDHPGYNNIYQINARTELALRYNDISPLENHHCSIAFRLLEHPECNIFKNFGRDTFNQIREGIIRCILATDMARHNEILTQFKEVTPIFDYSNRAHINLLCMILIKVADISNEARPMDVAEPWLDRLLQEFFAQSAAEKSEGLPVTPFMDPDKVSKPGSQVRFIGLVLLPLFEALGDLVPEVIELIIIPVRVALDYYRRLNDAQSKSRKSVADSSGSAAASENNSGASDGAAANSGGGGGGSGAAASSGGGGGGNSGGSISPQMPRSQSGISVKSRRSIPSQKSASRTSVDEPQCIAAELHDLPEGSESGDSETATEVDVAEKTSKFKVDTEGSSNRSKSSHSTSRKSSREKRPSMIGEMCSSGGGQRIRNSYGNIHGYHSNRCHFGSNRAVSLDQYSSNNRRLSDGLQQVISDSNVFYNRQNTRGSLETNAGSVSGGGGGCRLIEDLNMNAAAAAAVAAGIVIAAQPTANSHAQLQSSPFIVPNNESGSVGGGGIIALPYAAAVVHSAAATATAATSNNNNTNQHNTNNATSFNGNLSPTQPKQHCCAAAAAAAAAAAVSSSNSAAANGIATNGASASTAAAAGAKSSSSSSWKARFKQFSDYFSFSFDKSSSKRYNSSTRSSPCSVRNNNATTAPGSLVGGGGMLLDPLTGKPGGVCCTISNNLQSPGGVAGGGGGGMLRGHTRISTQHELISAAGRHRAYSLDVPMCGGRSSNPRYSSSSGGGGDSSRKSSRHDGGVGGGGAHSGDDNNSNNTLHSCGGSEMPTCLPPPIRIGSVDASVDTILITTAALGLGQRVLTPAQLVEAEPSLSIDLGMASGSSSAEPPKI